MSGYSVAFLRIAQLGLAVGTGNLKDREPWVYAFGDPNGVSEWRVIVNGRRVEQTHANWGQPIPPTSAVIEFNGWPFGILNPGLAGLLVSGIALWVAGAVIDGLHAYRRYGARWEK